MGVLVFLIYNLRYIAGKMDPLANFISARELQQTSNEEEIRGRAGLILDCIIQLQKTDEKSLKEQINALLTKIQEINTLETNTVKSKFYSLLILCFLTEKNVLAQRKEEKNNKLFSLLASSNLLKEMRNIADSIDPLKQINEKGKNILGKNQKYGNDYIRLTLELIKYWSGRFPETSKKEKSAYRKYYEGLVDKKVVFPTEYKFLPFGNTNGTKRESITKSNIQNNQTPNLAQLILGNSSKPSVQTDVHYMYGKLQNFTEDLDGDINQVEPQISKNHKQFQVQLKRFQNMQDDVFNSGDEETINKYLKIIGFMNEQSRIHKQYLTNSRDFQSYITALKMYAENQFADTAKGPKESIKKVESVDYNSGKRKYDSNGLTIKNISNKYDSVSPSIAGGQPPAVEPKIMASVNNYFNRLQERSKSPINVGFKKINDSLSKEKILSKRTVSPLSKNKNLSKSINSLKQSKLASIFTSPPNTHPAYKAYEGLEIYQNLPLYQQLKSINKSQGIRRFKTANFKGKSSLFENEHIQIGYKSEALYEQINGFKLMIKFQLFFGNLTDSNIKGLSLEFKGDPNVLLYANPRNIENVIVPSEQNKIELVVIPIKTPFPLLTINVTYKTSDKEHQCKFLLPNSVLKLAHFMDITKQELSSRWIYAQIYKTSEFKLCHYLPPQTFTKWIPALGELTSYNEFANPGSNKDYELYCVVIMLQKYEGLLKITIRPNLNVIIQLGIQDKNEQSIGYFSFLLESLQQFLKEVS